MPRRFFAESAFSMCQPDELRRSKFEHQMKDFVTLQAGNVADA
jgi:hypothetical protein